jgi:YidC/Oxa1 family membrane protein insertase
MQIQPQAGDPQQAKMMKIFMPIFFVVMFWFMPSGLGVYIFANMVLSLVQSAVQLRIGKPTPGATTPDSNSGENHAKPKKR